MSKSGNRLYLIALFFALLPEFVPTAPIAILWFGACLMVFFLLRSKKRHNSAHLRWMTAFMGFFSLSLLWSIKIVLSGWVIVYMVPIMIVSIGTMRYLTDGGSLLPLIKCIFALNLIMLLVLVLTGNFDVLSEGDRLGRALKDESGDSAWNGNSIGMNLCFAIFSGIILLQNGYTKRNLFVFLPIAVIFIIIILLTGSRKAVLILLIPLGVYFFQKSRKKLLQASLMAVVVGVIAFFVLMKIPVVYEVLGTRMETMVNMASEGTDAEGDVSRLFLIQYGIEWFTEHPILGVGINCFRVLSNNTAMFAGKNFYAHNNYLELLVDVGIVGTLIYYSGYIYLFNRMRKLGGRFALWGMSCFIILAFRDVAMVSYYSMFNHLLICILFHMASGNFILKTINK